LSLFPIGFKKNQKLIGFLTFKTLGAFLILMHFC